MKKMIDLFYFPVASDGDYLMDNQKNVVSKFECPEQAEHVANAVVCIDDLAEALESVLKTPRGTSGRIILEKEDEDDVRAALAAYRGEA